MYIKVMRSMKLLKCIHQLNDIFRGLHIIKLMIFELALIKRNTHISKKKMSLN